MSLRLAAYSSVKAVFIIVLLHCMAVKAVEPVSPSVVMDGCPLRIAVRSNMLYNAALTPDLGFELSMRPCWSLGIEGVYAWWSKESAHRCWRIRGFRVEPRFWFDGRTEERVLTGHHAGAYASYHDYDFEFGGKGWQSRSGTVGVGLSYGYSFRAGKRINIDVGMRAGYSTGRVVRYRPECGSYVCDKTYRNHYIGVTGLEVALVWFPGRGDANSPDRKFSEIW